MATLLSICQSAADRIGLPRPTQVASSIDQTTRTLLGCAQREGAALSRRWAWQALLREQTFLSVAATAQTNSIPTDWDGRMVSDTFWNRTLLRQVQGPLTSQEWQRLQASGVSAVTDAFRFRNDLIELVPTPTAGWTYAYEYISGQWCESATGTGQSAWATDTDVPRLDAELMTLGVIWRFLQGRGMDFSAAIADYETEVNSAEARDGSRRIVSLSAVTYHGARYPAVPEGSWDL
jgi:hypothetical protein